MTIQNNDRNIGPGAYDHLTKDQLLVTKIFFTHQGEGPFAGRPAIFLRLAGCNRGAKEMMGCAFCDTAFQFDQGRALRFHEIKHEIWNLFAGQDLKEEPILVITGGEPMMQDNLLYFLEFARGPEMGVPVIQIETNGDRIIPDFPDDPGIFIVVSPKVTRKGYLEPREHRLRWRRYNAFKFLISADPDSLYHSVPDWAREFNVPIMLSPITEYARALKPGEIASAWNDGLIDRSATALNYAYAAKLALQKGFRLSMQQHLFFEQE